MNVIFNIENKGQYIQIEPVGEVHDVNEYIDLQLKYFEIAIENKSKYLLIDVRNLIFPLGIMDQVRIVDHNLQNKQMEMIGTYKIAILINSIQHEIGSFYEDYSVNRGINVKLFETAAKAVDWLL